MLMKFKPSHVLAGLLSTCIVTPSLAQQDQSQDRQNQQRSQSSQEGQSQRDSASNRGSSDQARSGQSQSRLQVQPQGWVRMAVDYDNDGSYDAMETIYVYDLQMAQQRSRDRRSDAQGQSGSRSGSEMQRNRSNTQRQNAMRQRDSQRGQQQRDQQRMANRNRQQQSPVQSISGKVQNIKQITMHDGQSKFKVAKVKTNEGRTARVLLGNVEQVDRLNLQDGDQIRVDGRRGKINDRSILVANQIRSGDQSIRVQFDNNQKPLRQYKGTVEQTRTAQFRNRDGVFLVAKLETENGDSKVVNLGPTSKISPSAVKNADEVCVLASTGKVNGQEALIAEQISLDGRKIDVSKDDGRPQNWNTSNSGSASNRNQRQQR